MGTGESFGASRPEEINPQDPEKFHYDEIALTKMVNVINDSSMIVHLCGIAREWPRSRHIRMTQSPRV
jgi:hypothetical protein